MKFLSTMTVVALAATAVASPQRGSSACVGKQQVSCCNTSKSSQKVGFGIFGLFQAILAPGTCSPISLPIVGALFQQYCGNNVAQCCQNNQGGIINISLGQCVAFPF